jgi:dTDP-4-dehydrorhamnose reductase
VTVASGRVRFLIIGGSGYLGSVLTRQAVAAGHEVLATYLRRPGDAGGARWRQLDIRMRPDVDEMVAAVRADAIVNAAYRSGEWQATADGAANVAVAAVRQGARLVHMSSDAVFAGSATAYDEGAVPDPITRYGAAKAAAETAIRAVDPSGAIVRTSLIIGDGRSPHEAAVHDLATGRRDGVLFSDEIRCPVHVADLAAALLELAAAESAGIHNVAGIDALSRYELGCLIARRDGLDEARLPAGLQASLGLPRPLDVRLDCRATQARLHTRLRGAREFLAQPSS